MADSAARVRVFSDDGHCVDDAVLMRRALEYVKAFDGVIAQHAQEPRLTVGAQMNEGVVSARRGLAGGPASPSCAETMPSFIWAPTVSRGSCACWAITPSKALTYSSARRISTASSTQCP